MSSETVVILAAIAISFIYPMIGLTLLGIFAGVWLLGKL